MISANSRYQRSANCLLFLNLLREGPLSRTELSQITGMQPSTVTYAVNRLIGNGNVVELAGKQAVAAHAPGRRRNLVGINNNHGRIAGVELMPEYARLTLASTSGAVVKSVRFENRPRTGSDSVLHFMGLVGDVAQAAVELASPIPLMGICIAVPGMIAEGNTRIESCWTHDLYGQDFAEFFSSLPVAVFLENDANCSAMKQLWEGDGGCRNFFYLLVNEHERAMVPVDVPSIGVGLGVILNGELYRGSTSSAGEYKSSRLMAESGRACQVSMDEAGILSMKTDRDARRRFVTEIMEDVFTLSSVMDPDAIYVGGVLGRPEFAAEAREVADTRPALRERPVLLPESGWDISGGAAACVLDKLYHLPKVGEDGEYDARLQRAFLGPIANTAD